MNIIVKMEVKIICEIEVKYNILHFNFKAVSFYDNKN